MPTLMCAHCGTTLLPQRQIWVGGSTAIAPRVVCARCYVNREMREPPTPNHSRPTGRR